MLQRKKSSARVCEKKNEETENRKQCLICRTEKNREPKQQHVIQ
jgi:hypothetical protein